jgi:hypothetical protein
MTDFKRYESRPKEFCVLQVGVSAYAIALTRCHTREGHRDFRIKFTGDTEAICQEWIKEQGGVVVE